MYSFRYGKGLYSIRGSAVCMLESNISNIVCTLYSSVYSFHNLVWVSYNEHIKLACQSSMPTTMVNKRTHTNIFSTSIKTWWLLFAEAERNYKTGCSDGICKNVWIKIYALFWSYMKLCCVFFAYKFNIKQYSFDFFIPF